MCKMNTSYGRIRNLLAVKTDVCLNDRRRGQEPKASREKLEWNVWREYAAFQTCRSRKSMPQLFWPLLWRNDDCFRFGVI
jgi:hypothetical protein